MEQASNSELHQAILKFSGSIYILYSCMIAFSSDLIAARCLMFCILHTFLVRFSKIDLEERTCGDSG